MSNHEQDLGAEPRTETPETDGLSPDEGRADPRVPFLGYPVTIRTPAGTAFAIRMRDLSCGGASGLCEEALDVGAYVTVCLAKGREVEAQVRWVRQMKVGLKFTEPLAPGFVRRLHQSHGTFVTTRAGK